MQVGYEREQRLMLGFVHNLGEQRARDLLMQQPVQQKYGPTSWLAQQRRDVRIFFHSASCSSLMTLIRSSGKRSCGDTHDTDECFMTHAYIWLDPWLYHCKLCLSLSALV